jgi:phosphatidylglycerophosphate synthase
LTKQALSIKFITQLLPQEEDSHLRTVISWIPNAVSLMRIPLTILTVTAALDQRWYDAFVWLCSAVVTDMIDGTLARALNARSERGSKYIDPFSDGFMGFTSMLGLALQPGGYAWALYLPASLIIAIVLKLSKHSDSKLWHQRVSNAALPLCYASTMIAVLMAYAMRIGGDTTWVYQTTFSLLPLMAYLKRQRVKDWWAGKQ